MERVFEDRNAACGREGRGGGCTARDGTSRVPYVASPGVGNNGRAMWRLKMRTAAAALIAAGALAGCGLPALGEGGRSGGPAPVPGGAGAEGTDGPAPRDPGARQRGRAPWRDR